MTPLESQDWEDKVASDEFKESLLILLEKKKMETKQIDEKTKSKVNKPKAPRTGYIIYLQENLAQGLKNIDISKAWKTIDATEKQKYLDQSKEEKAQWQ